MPWYGDSENGYATTAQTGVRETGTSDLFIVNIHIDVPNPYSQKQPVISRHQRNIDIGSIKSDITDKHLGSLISDNFVNSVDNINT